MKNMGRLFFIFLLAVLFAAICLWPKKIASADSANVEVRDFQALYLKKASSDVKIEEIATTYSKDFIPFKGETIHFWNVRDVLWLRIPVDPLQKAMKNLSMENPALILNSEYISRADLFLPAASGGYKQSSHGLDIAVEDRSYPSRLPSFSLKNIDPEGFLYVKVKTDFPIGFDVKLQEERSFFVSFVDRLGQYIAFYAFLFSLALLYIFFYFMTGSINYFIVGIRQLGILIFILSLSGYLQYYFSVSSTFVHISSWLGLFLYIFSATFLWQRLLLTDKFDKHLRLMQKTQIAVSVMMLISMLFQSIYFSLFTVGLVFAMEIIAVAVIALKKFKRQTSVLFVVSSRLAFVVGLLFLFRDMLAESRDLNVYIFIIALLLDPLFLIYLLIPTSRNRFESYQKMEEKSAHFEKLSKRDSMTGLYNKANLLSILGDEIKRAHSQDTPLAFLMLDIDYFKKFNDTWGHPEGDVALILLAKIIRQSLRERDEAARYGGEEFSIILPGGTHSTAALVAERIRKAIEVQSHSLGEGKNFTLSLGIAFLRSSDDVSSLIKRADEALYLAKTKGRNRVEIIK